MTEYPGFLPWHVAGDPWFTHAELDALVSEADRRAGERKKQADEAKRKAKRARGRGRSRGRSRRR